MQEYKEDRSISLREIFSVFVRHKKTLGVVFFLLLGLTTPFLGRGACQYGYVSSIRLTSYVAVKETLSQPQQLIPPLVAIDLVTTRLMNGAAEGLGIVPNITARIQESKGIIVLRSLGEKKQENLHATLHRRIHAALREIEAEKRALAKKDFQTELARLEKSIGVGKKSQAQLLGDFCRIRKDMGGQGDDFSGEGVFFEAARSGQAALHQLSNHKREIEESLASLEEQQYGADMFVEAGKMTGPVNICGLWAKFLAFLISLCGTAFAGLMLVFFRSNAEQKKNAD